MKRAALALVAALAVPAGLAAQTTVDQKHPAAPDATVKIENSAGSTKVTGWDRAEVQVRGTICSRCELELDGTDKLVKIEIESTHMNPMAGKSDIEVLVPAGASVSVEGFQATIVVAGVSGSVKAETVNGAVTVRDAGGEIEASTVNGLLTVTGGSFSRVQIETVSGGARFDAALGPKAELSVESVSGSVELIFPASFGGEFSVTTFSGPITNELGPAAEKTNDFTPQKELTFTSGGGGARVSVETLSGAVQIKKRP